MATRKEMADKYIRSIRNAAKRAYAEQYLKWYTNPPTEAEPDRGALSYMGAQAVRINIAEICAVSTEDK